MKRIILGLSLLLILVQNGFARSDAEWNQKISNAVLEVDKQIARCNKIATNHIQSGDVNICLKALKLEEKIYPNATNVIAALYGNVGLLYDESKGDKLKAYKYYMKAARLGSIQAQKNLNIMCKESSWACK